MVTKSCNSRNAPWFSIYKGNLKNIGGKSHRLAFIILKEICACFDGSVPAAQFLTSRRFRRHPYQYDLCPSSVICHSWHLTLLTYFRCQRWQMTDISRIDMHQYTILLIIGRPYPNPHPQYFLNPHPHPESSILNCLSSIPAPKSRQKCVILSPKCPQKCVILCKMSARIACRVCSFFQLWWKWPFNL